jgi:hypothetical protein
MIQAVLRTDCKSGGRVSIGNENGTTDSTAPGGRCVPMLARRVRRIGLVATVWAPPDDSRFVASVRRRRQSRILDKPGSTVTI